MIESLSVGTDFKAVPYLPGSSLMKRHKRKLAFSLDKPNVLVGPNGSGKSALLRTLSLRFMTHYTGVSAFNDQYVSGRGDDTLWYEENSWTSAPQYMRGMNLVTDNAPSLFYRPYHLPGNEPTVVHAMITGYDKQARAFAKLTERKSSGQQSQATLARVVRALAGEELPTDYILENWSHEKNLRDLRKHRGHVGLYEYRAEQLKKLFLEGSRAKPLVMMDEPEQSLDALAEAELWSAIASTDCSKVQVIVASHSLYPLLHREQFNLIETQAGFADEVLGLMKNFG
ncbi:ATP-binding protein [Burkholderia cenocepacia]|uniref:ATP-binding protein n=1 Tax=Burkholderia cenocepacia TaxID=95486 RepID=UPI000761C37A|nr:ATP-binding protein [Burkholderia cenocepacia]KWU23435.1 hypothetical protein AS149_37230 [Burkholderia cenocepacia]